MLKSSQNIITKEDDLLTLVQSYVAWWDMAGFDQAVDTKIANWLTKKNSIKSPRSESTPHIGDSSIISVGKSGVSKADNSRAHAIASVTTNLSQDSWPKTLRELREAILKGDALPGNIYGSKYVGPRYLRLAEQETTPDQKTIMLISDFPNTQDLAEKSLLSGREYQLIVNMLTAAGLQTHNIYCASLASTQPVYDELPEQDLPLIHLFIRHHIEVLDPDIIISLGSTACNALLNAELMKSRENLHYFNLNDKEKILLTTFHPKTLLANPKLKEKAWRDLQLLMKKDIL